MNYNELPGTRATTLKAYLHASPMVAAYKNSNPTDCAAFAIGRLFHSMMETNIYHTAPPGYVVLPQEFKTNYSQKAIRFAEDIDPHADIVTEKDFLTCRKMAESVQTQTPPEIAAMLKNCQKEQAYFFDGYKAQLDVDSPLGVMDWKTMTARNLHAFSRMCVTYGYTLQAYHYLMCRQQTTDFQRLLEIPFYFGVVCKEPPYEVLFFEIGVEALAHGQEQWEYAIAQQKKNIVNAHENKIVTLDLPSWAMPETELEDF